MKQAIQWVLRRMHFIQSKEHAHALQMSYAQDRALQRLINLVEAQRAARDGNRATNQRSGDTRT